MLFEQSQSVTKDTRLTPQRGSHLLAKVPLGRREVLGLAEAAAKVSSEPCEKGRKKVKSRVPVLRWCHLDACCPAASAFGGGG